MKKEQIQQLFEQFEKACYEAKEIRIVKTKKCPYKTI
jgi:hypothetical protein